MLVKSLPHETKNETKMKDVYVELGIAPYVKIANSIENVYTVGCCEGHIYEEEHVLHHDYKKTLGWVQLLRMEKDYESIQNLLKLLKLFNEETKKNLNDPQIVVILDPFSKKLPCEYNRVYMSSFMWNIYLNKNIEYTLMGLDEIVIVNDDGKVVGVYKNILLSTTLKSRLKMRDCEIYSFI